MKDYVRVECDCCYGTGKSSYGPELHQEHTCGKCNGVGYVLVKPKKVG